MAQREYAPIEYAAVHKVARLILLMRQAERVPEFMCEGCGGRPPSDEHDFRSVFFAARFRLVIKGKVKDVDVFSGIHCLLLQCPHSATKLRDGGITSVSVSAIAQLNADSGTTKQLIR